jgi:hypothetical protein
MDSVRKVFYQDERVKSLLETIIGRYKEISTFDSIFTIRMDSLKALERQYAHYTSDSLFINANDYLSFTDVLKKIIVTPKEKLEDLEADKKLLMADGASFSFHIQTRYERKIVNSINLDAILHPLLYRLYAEILDIYKKEKGKNFPT